MSLTELALDCLILSSLNVRRTERDAELAGLADSIAEAGLKQNLVVVPAHFSSGEAEAGWDDKWEVVDGGRRFQAMQLLVADGRWPADAMVPCRLEDRDHARETSLLTNLQRVAMNPADEFAAFQQIVEDLARRGASELEAVERCARRFGVTVKHVQGRLRLAALAPDILEALQTGKISLDIAKAYAGTSDHDLQRKVFAEASKSRWMGAKDIRNRLRERTFPIDSPLVHFVGLADYKAAGGRIESEMFMGTDGEQRVVDVPLLEKLVRRYAEALIPQQAKNDGFKSGLFAFGIGQHGKWPKPPAGFEKAWDNGAAGKAECKKRIAVYAVAYDTAALIRIGSFKPVQKQKAEPERDWNAERIAEQRKRGIALIAARMAVQLMVESMSMEGSAFWPQYHAPAINLDDEETVEVGLIVRIPRAAMESHLAEAEPRYEFALLAKAEALAAETAAHAEEDAALDDDDENVDVSVDCNEDSAA